LVLQVSAGSIKSRLGVKSRLGPKVTHRIGEAVLDNHERVEIYECEDDDLDTEDHRLRANAIKTLDLRSRLTTRPKQVGDQRTRSQFFIRFFRGKNERFPLKKSDFFQPWDRCYD
jgi:hypothetical protein